MLAKKSVSLSDCGEWLLNPPLLYVIPFYLISFNGVCFFKKKIILLYPPIDWPIVRLPHCLADLFLPPEKAPVYVVDTSTTTNWGLYDYFGHASAHKWSRLKKLAKAKLLPPGTPFTSSPNYPPIFSSTLILWPVILPRTNKPTNRPSTLTF